MVAIATTPAQEGREQDIMTTTNCAHGTTREISADGYSGSVATSIYAENRAAHGNIDVTVECVACGARRHELINGLHIEVGPWGPTRGEREAAARRVADLAAIAQRAADRRHASARVRVLRVVVDDAMLSIDGGPMIRIALDDIHEAASQSDTGDGLVPMYRGILALVDDARRAH